MKDCGIQELLAELKRVAAISTSTRGNDFPTSFHGKAPLLLRIKAGTLMGNVNGQLVGELRGPNPHIRWRTPSMSEARIDDLLKTVVELGASDLHLAVPNPPVIRLNGGLQRLVDSPPLTAEMADDILRSVTSDAERETFYRERELDFSYNVPGLARFRVNAGFKQGTVCLSLRPVPITIPTLESLGLPEVCKKLIPLPSITTSVQGGMWGDARMAARRLAWERLARSLLSCVSSSHRSNSVGPNRSRGSISRTTR